MAYEIDDSDDTCGGLGYIECYCGGDNCVCDWNGEIPCGGCDQCEPNYDELQEDYGD